MNLSDETVAERRFLLVFDEKTFDRERTVRKKKRAVVHGSGSAPVDVVCRVDSGQRGVCNARTFAEANCFLYL